MANLRVKRKIILRVRKGSYKLVKGKTEQADIVPIRIHVHNIN